MILLGAPLNEVLTSITRLIEAHSKAMLCSISLTDLVFSADAGTNPSVNSMEQVA
jgi:hypothetical protein